MEWVCEIKFKHDFDKLAGVRNKDELLLLSATKVDYDDLPCEFIDYDIKHAHGNFGLEPGQYILLVFYHKSNKVITTLRKYDYGKFKFYDNSLFYSFTVIKEFEF